MSDELPDIESDDNAPEALHQSDEFDTKMFRQHQTRGLGLTRVRIEWNSRDAEIVHQVNKLVTRELVTHFVEAFSMMESLRLIVRNPVLLPNGEHELDEFGMIRWQHDADGNVIEDFSRLTRGEKEHFLFLIITHIVEWEIRAENAWADAMLAKTMWEHSYANAFNDPEGGKTVDARTSHARSVSIDDRYFAVVRTSYSRQASALIRNLKSLSQRLRDSLMMT